MADDLDTFIQQHKAQLEHERQEFQQTPSGAKTQRRTWDKTPLSNGFKENVPPQSPQEVGLVSKMGGHEEQQRRAREQLKQEYNQYLAQQQNLQRADVRNAPAPTAQRAQPQSDGFLATLPGLGNDVEAQQRKIAERNREYNEFLRQNPKRGTSRDRNSSGPQQDNEEYGQWSREKPPPPRTGWATPTYEEILEKKRLEERTYRRNADADIYDGDGRIGDRNYTRNSVSDGQLNRVMEREEPRAARNTDPDYDTRKVRFDNGARADPAPRRMQQSQSQRDFHTDGDAFAGLPPRSQRAAQRPTEKYNATLLIGQEVRESDDRRKKAQYREELRRQMAEMSNRRKNDVEIMQQPSAPLYNPPQPQPAYSRQVPPAPAPAPSFVPQTTLPTALPVADDFGLRPGNTLGHAPQVDSILNNGFNFDQLSRPVYPIAYPSVPAASALSQPARPLLNLGTMAVPQVAPSLGPYRSPLEDAYLYYGFQNPLDASLGAQNAPLLPVRPAAQMDRAAPPMLDNRYNDYNQPQMATSRFRRDYPAELDSDQLPAFGDPEANSNPANPIQGVGEINDRRAAEDKKRLYQLELQRQMEEDKRKKQKAKEEKEAYDRKLEEDIKNYNPFGRGGAGAPMRDKYGNIIASRKGGESENPQRNGGTSNRAAPPPPPPVNDPGNRWQYNVQSPRIDGYRMAGAVNQPSAGDDSEQTHARGGHGIFGEPMSDEQKNAKQKYQDDLRRQIEEKKQREKEERDRAAKEEELLMKRIEEENRRIKQQEEDERKKAQEKAAEAERKQQQLIQQQEEIKKETERKKKEARALQEEQRRIEEDRRRQTDEPRRPESRMIGSQNARQEGFNSRQEGYNSRIGPSPSPRVQNSRNDTTTAPARKPSAEVLGQLARMKQQLQSERRRVETDLNRERMEPVVFDPREAALKAPSTYDVEVVQLNNGRRRPSVARNPRIIHPVPDDGGSQLHDDYIPEAMESYSERDRQEAKQKALIEQQEEDLRRMRLNGNNYDSRQPRQNSAAHGRRSRAGEHGGVLDSESDFIDIPPSSRAEMRTDLDDLARQRNNQSRNRRRQRIDSMNQMGSQVSLNPQDLDARNDDRLRRLKSLAGDDISVGGDPDTILNKFMSKVGHQRPPSSYTLEDDSWLRPGSRR